MEIESSLKLFWLTLCLVGIIFSLGHVNENRTDHLAGEDLLGTELKKNLGFKRLQNFSKSFLAFKFLTPPKCKIT